MVLPSLIINPGPTRLMWFCPRCKRATALPIKCVATGIKRHTRACWLGDYRKVTAVHVGCMATATCPTEGEHNQAPASAFYAGISRTGIVCLPKNASPGAGCQKCFLPEVTLN